MSTCLKLSGHKKKQIPIFKHGVIQAPSCLGDVMVSMLALREVDRGFEAWLGKNRDLKLIFATSPLSTQH